MSNADNADAKRWGTIFMGPTSDRESTLDKLTDKKQRELWTQRTESEYLARVRSKATQRVEAMLKSARIQADELREGTRQWSLEQRNKIKLLNDHADSEQATATRIREEAEHMFEHAREDGYQHGMEQAVDELNGHRAQLDVTTAAVLQAIQSQSASLFEAWRDDMTLLLRCAVETATGWILTEERQAVLDALLAQSLQLLEDRRRIVIHAHPEDVAAVEACLVSAKSRFTEIHSWDILPDDAQTPGGLVVESVSGKVDNTIDVRHAIVEEVLRQLTLEAGPPDALAEAAVLNAMEDAGVPQLAADGMAVLDQLETARQQELAQALPEQALPEEALPEEALPEQALPEEALPEQALPEENLSEAPLPEEILPKDACESIPLEPVLLEEPPEEHIENDAVAPLDVGPSGVEMLASDAGEHPEKEV